MQLTEESVALPKFPFVFFRLLGTQTLGPNLYATLSYTQIFSLHPLSREKYDDFLHKIEFVLYFLYMALGMNQEMLDM